MLTIRQLCPEVKKHADCLVYEVGSDSRPGHWHRVDLSMWSGFGACSCEHFEFKINPLLKGGIVPTQEMECRHIRAARRYLAIEATQGIIRIRQHEAEQNQEENAHQPSKYKAGETPF